MVIPHGTPMTRILLFDFLILSRAYQIFVGMRTLSNVSHIKEKLNGIIVVDFNLVI